MVTLFFGIGLWFLGKDARGLASLADNASCTSDSVMPRQNAAVVGGNEKFKRVFDDRNNALQYQSCCILRNSFVNLKSAVNGSPGEVGEWLKPTVC